MQPRLSSSSEGAGIGSTMDPGGNMSNVSEQEFGTLLSIISRCNEDQSKRAIEALNNRRTLIGRQKIHTIRVGARVKWNGKHGPQVGTVMKVKHKYVECKADGQLIGYWNVPANMLEPA